MPCPSPFDAFRLATESLPDEIYYTSTWRDIWNSLIPKDEFKSGMGLNHSTFTLGRSEPTDDEPDAQLISLSTDGNYTGSCNTEYDDVEYGFDENVYHPEQFGWRGPIICQDDLIYNYKAARFLDGYVQSITKNTLRSIGNRQSAIYSHFVPKSVANTDYHLVDGGTGDPPKSPTLTLDESVCDITQEMLDQTAVELIQDGASDPDSNGWISLSESGPLFPLYIGMEASQRLLLNNAELREDRRHADSGKGDGAMLFQRLGASRVIKNFRHVINLQPPRYTYSGGAYHRVATFSMVAASKGKKAQLTDAYKAAPFEGLYVLSPWVFHSEVIRPVNSAAGLSWKPKNYMGQWTFITGGRNISEDPECYDPEEKLGRHFASWKHAPRPIFPQYGRLIIFNRCAATDFNCQSCS